jgi:hypothetical protein
LDVEPDRLTGVYKNMVRGIVALVFRCKITGGELATTAETAAFRWADEHDISDLAAEVYAVRILDALRGDASPAVRDHDGRQLL